MAARVALLQYVGTKPVMVWPGRCALNAQVSFHGARHGGGLSVYPAKVIASCDTAGRATLSSFAGQGGRGVGVPQEGRVARCLA